MDAPSLPKHFGPALRPYRFERRYADWQEHWITTHTNALGFRKLVAVGVWACYAPAISSPWFQDHVRPLIPELLKLNHPGLAQLYEWGIHKERPYRAYEYVSGIDLRRLTQLGNKKGRPLPRALSVWIVQKLCEVLDYSHRFEAFSWPVDRLLNRVMISSTGEIKLMDYGESKLQWKLSISYSRPDPVKESFCFMSPEHIMGLPLARPSTVFSLGTLLYTLATGHQPFLRESPMQTLIAIREGKIPAPTQLDSQFCPSLQRIIQKAMLRKVDARFPTAGEMASTLLEYLKRSRARASTAELRGYFQALFPTALPQAQSSTRADSSQRLCVSDTAPTVRIFIPGNVSES